MKYAVCLALPLLIAAPLFASTETATMGEVALDQKLRLGAIQVRPLEVIEDSRCPLPADCNGLNRIVVRTEIRGRGMNKVRDFQIGDIRLVGDGLGLTLSAVSPSPPTSASIAPGDYRFRFEITR